LLREYDQEDEVIALASVQFKIALADVYNKGKFELVNSDTLEVETFAILWISDRL
jgi:hypothetical protein